MRQASCRQQRDSNNFRKLEYYENVPITGSVTVIGSFTLYEISVRRSILRTDRPTDDLTFGKMSNGHITARGRPIHFMFGSSVGFLGSADRMALFPV